MVSLHVTTFLHKKTWVKIWPQLKNGTELHSLLELLFDPWLTKWMIYIIEQVCSINKCLYYNVSTCTHTVVTTMIKMIYISKYGLVGCNWFPVKRPVLKFPLSYKMVLYDIYWCEVLFNPWVIYIIEKVSNINSCLYHHVSTCTCTAVTMAKIQFLTI